MFRPEQLLLQPSRCLLWLLLLIHSAAAIAPFLSVLTPLISLLLVVPVAVHGGYLYRRDVALKLAASVTALGWDEQRWWLRYGDGAESDIEPTRYTVMTAQLVLLHYRPKEGGRGRMLVIFPDSGDAQAIRRLRVQLRFSLTPSSAPSIRN